MNPHICKICRHLISAGKLTCPNGHWRAEANPISNTPTVIMTQEFLKKIFEAAGWRSSTTSLHQKEEDRPTAPPPPFFELPVPPSVRAHPVSQAKVNVFRNLPHADNPFGDRTKKRKT